MQKELDANGLVELTRDMVTQLDRTLRMSKSDYIDEFGCEAERVDKAKIENAVNMLSTLKFFIDRVSPLDDPDATKTKEAKKQPLNG